MNTTKSTKSSSGYTRQSASTGGSATAASATKTATTVASASPCGCFGCGCHSHGPEGCCKLTCFERPKYFCGQLLSDADLTLQETYFRDKNKLYHRALDGFGVVCGLQMRCDCDCKGHILIGNGYAVDCCGNDLVVCEPRRFDVIGELRKKKKLIEAPCDPPRRPEQQNDREESDCIHKRCFYIGICYAEEPLEFATPYTTECNPAPGPCLPTRIREDVRFEVYDELPVRPNRLEEIEKRIECCFKMYREGQFARGLRQITPRIMRVLGFYEGTWEEEEPRAHSLFEELRAQFIHELCTCPDHYNCDLEREVRRLRAPGLGNDELAPPPFEAFTRLFTLIQKHVFSCVLAQLAFPCPEPDPCCVLIGSVEVVNGRLTRVINNPRWYLWCFANFWEVLIYTLAYDAACARPEPARDPVAYDPPPRSEGSCCPEFEVDVRGFLTLFEAENRFPQFAALASVNAIRAMRQSLVSGFDFIKPGGVVPGVFDKLDPKEARRLADALGIKIEAISDAPHEHPDPYSALLANLVHRGTDPLAFFEREDHVTGATRIMTAPAWPTSQPETPSRRQAKAMEQRIQQLEKDLQTLRDSLPKQGGSGGKH